MPAAKKKAEAAAPVNPTLKPVPVPLPPPVEDEQETGEGRGAGLPLISVLDESTMDAAKELLYEAKELRERMDKDAERLEEIKASLVGIADAYELKGFRTGPIGLEYHGWKTKKTLDKRKLLENGVDADTIAASYTESKPFVSARFVAIRV